MLQNVSSKYSFKVKVSTKDIDQLNHVNNVQYLNWVQTAAIEHWSKLSNKEIDDKFVWVVARHEIDYLFSALLNDELTIITWIGETKGKISERFVTFYKKGKPIVKVKTIWCLMNKKTMKSTLIPKEVYQLLSN